MKKEKYFIVAAIYIKGDQLLPEQVSTVLGLSPTENRAKGSTKRLASGKDVLAPTGLWILREEHYCESADKFIADFISRHRFIGEKKNLLHGVQDIFLDFFIALPSDGDGDSEMNFKLQPETMKDLSEIDIPTNFSINIANDP